MNSRENTTESSMTSKALWKEHTLCTMYADMCLFTPWISIIGDAPNYRIPERMQIGTSLFPFSAPLYLPRVLPKRHPLILSNMNHQLIYQEDMRLKDKKRKVVRERWNGRSAEWEDWKCVDGREERWEAKVDSGKIGKRGLKGLLRDGNTSVETTRFKDQNEDGVQFGGIPRDRKATRISRSPSSQPVGTRH